MVHPIAGCMPYMATRGHNAHITTPHPVLTKDREKLLINKSTIMAANSPHWLEVLELASYR